MRSTSPPTNPKPLAIPSGEPSKSNTLRRLRKLHAARPLLLRKQCPSHAEKKPRYRPQMDTSRPQALGLLARQALSKRQAGSKNLSDPCQIIRRLETRPRLLLVRLQVVLSALQGCPRVETRTDSHLLRLWLRQMPKVASRNPRASNTRYPHLIHSHSTMLRKLQRRPTLASQARNEHSRCKWDHMAQRAHTGVPTL